MPTDIRSLASVNLWSAAIIAVILLSAVQGGRRGASGSARQLMGIVMEGVLTVAAILISWALAEWLSPQLQSWLTRQNINVPNQQLTAWARLYYTFVTALRDFSLMRTALLFLAAYTVIKGILARGLFYLFDSSERLTPRSTQGASGALSSIVGAGLGALTGCGRALMLIAVLFIWTALMPQSGYTQYIQQSAVYQKGAAKIIRPVTGDWFDKQLPVFTREVGTEFSNILQRKYEVLDANIPDNIAAAAKEVTAKAQTDQDKAKALYQWIGTRVQYDWDKVNLYETQGIWKEQTPEDTFRTRKGVCIDYSRLYAVMAKSVGLQAKVVTGLGYDGNGGYGAHAWNEVYLPEQQKWIPLDSTWVASGDNWFNPANFNETHIKDA